MKTNSNTIVVIVLVLFTFAAAPAAAQDVKAVYEKAVADFKASRYLEAAEGFRKANELKPSWKLYYNIGQSEAAAKRHGLALEAFEAYLSKGGDDISDSRREDVLKEVERLRKMVGSIQVEAPKGSSVFVDGVERGKAPLLGKLPVAAGVEHTAHAVIEGERGEEVAFKVMGDDTATVSLSLVEENPPPPVVDPEQQVVGEGGDEMLELGGEVDDQGKGLRTAGWVLVAVGGAALVGGAVTGGMTRSLDKELEGDCPNKYCDESRQEDVDRLGTLSVTTDILLGVGAVAAVTGVVLVVVGHKRGNEESAIALRPAVGQGSAGAFIEGSF